MDPWNGHKESSDNENTAPDIPQCDEDIMFAMDKLRSIILADISGEFFQHLFLCARRKKKVSGHVKYTTLTPSWLSKKYFLYMVEVDIVQLLILLVLFPEKVLFERAGTKD